MMIKFQSDKNIDIDNTLNDSYTVQNECDNNDIGTDRLPTPQKIKKIIRDIKMSLLPNYLDMKENH